MKDSSSAPVLRTCLACRAVLPRVELLRFFVKSAEIRLDLNNRGGGRGAYICAGIECLNKIRKRKGVFARAFRVNLAQKGLENFYTEISDMLNADTGNEAIKESKLKLHDKRHN